MAKGINKVILIGNLGQDPDQKALPNGNAVTNVSLATSRTWKDKNSGEQKEKTEWHRIVFFNRLAEIAAQYLKKERKFISRANYGRGNGTKTVKNITQQK